MCKILYLYIFRHFVVNEMPLNLCCMLLVFIRPIGRFVDKKPPVAGGKVSVSAGKSQEQFIPVVCYNR